MGSLEERNVSLWVATTPAPDFPVFDGDPRRVDVVVVGSGITGLTTAALLKAEGATVAVVEAGRVCSGVTAYTTAKVTALHGLTYAKILDGHDEDRARAYAEANQVALERIAAMVAERDIDCDFSRRSAYTYTTRPRTVAAIEAEVDAAVRLGLPARMVTETELPFDVAAAIRLDDQAQFDPRRYCLALAAGIPGDGSHVFERTRVLKVGGRRPCVVRTEHGTLRADHVVLATQLPFADRGGFFALCSPNRSYALALRPAGPVPTGMYLSADQPTRSVRAAQGDELLLVGGQGHTVGADPDTTRRYRALRNWAGEHFGTTEVVHRWSAQDYLPADDVPYVGRLLPGSPVFVATGFKKWGMTNGTAAAMILTDVISGRDNPWAQAFDSTRRRPLTTRKFFLANLAVAGRFVGNRVAGFLSKPAERLRPGEGGVTRLDGRTVAAYRDEEGTLHAVSARCQHLGCLVAFNTAERTWDCPCHGSRYTVDGKAIQGPTVKDLPPHSVKQPEA